MGLHGSVMYDACLSDNQVIRRHGDQLRPRVTSGMSDKSTTDSAAEDMTLGGGVTTRTDTHGRDAASAKASSSPPEATDSPDPSGEPPVVNSGQQEELNNQETRAQILLWAGQLGKGTLQYVSRTTVMLSINFCITRSYLYAVMV